MASIQAILMLTLVVLMLPGCFYLAAWMTGWARLARRHPGAAPQPGAVWSRGSLSIGSRFLNYNSIVRFASDDDHLHISLAPPFRWMFHPPMSVPWAAVVFLDRPDPDRFRLRRVRLRIDDVSLWAPLRAVRTELLVRRHMDDALGREDAALEPA